MLTVKKIINHDYIFCDDMQSIILFSEKISYYTNPVPVGTFLFCTFKNYNIIGLDKNLEEYFPFLEIKKNLINENICKLITYINCNNYVEKLAKFYKDYSMHTRLSNVIFNRNNTKLLTKFLKNKP